MTRVLEEFEKGYLDCFPTWQALDEILGSKIVKPLYIWLLIVPVLAKITADVPNNILLVVPPGNQNIELKLEIPFNWVLLYFGGLSLVFAHAIYIWYCPKFVRNHKTAYSAISSGVTVQHIRSIAADFLKDSFADCLPRYNSLQGSSLRRLLQQYRANVDELDFEWRMGSKKIVAAGLCLFDALERVSFKVDQNGIYEFDYHGTYGDNSIYSTTVALDRDQLLKHLCWDLIQLQNISTPPARAATTILIGASFLLLLIPFSQSAWFVAGLLPGF